jgi:hypothetical protein
VIYVDREECKKRREGKESEREAINGPTRWTALFFLPGTGLFQTPAGKLFPIMQIFFGSSQIQTPSPPAAWRSLHQTLLYLPWINHLTTIGTVYWFCMIGLYKTLSKYDKFIKDYQM